MGGQTPSPLTKAQYDEVALTKAYFDSVALLKTYYDSVALLKTYFDSAGLLTEADFDTVMDAVKNRSGIIGFSSERDALEVVGEEFHHISDIFPDGSDETLTFTAGGTPNIFDAWAEVVDSGANKLSDSFTADTMITAFLIESCSVRDKVYIFELAYGDDKTIMARYRLIAGETVKLPAIQQIRIRSEHYPNDELVYYRMKCETAGATCELHIRYYIHGV